MSQNISINNVANASASSNFSAAFAPMQYVSSAIDAATASFATNIEPARLAPGQCSYVAGASPMSILLSAFNALPGHVYERLHQTELQVGLDSTNDFILHNGETRRANLSSALGLDRFIGMHGEMIFPMAATIWLGYKAHASIDLARITARVTEDREQVDIDLLCRNSAEQTVRVCCSFFVDKYYVDGHYDDDAGWHVSYQFPEGAECLCTNEYEDVQHILPLLFKAEELDDYCENFAR